MPAGNDGGHLIRHSEVRLDGSQVLLSETQLLGNKPLEPSVFTTHPVKEGIPASRLQVTQVVESRSVIGLDPSAMFSE